MTDFSFVIGLYEGGTGAPANGNDCEVYAQVIGASFPVLADGGWAFADATPMNTSSHPQTCVIAPDMTILACYQGHGKIDDALQDIRNHAGI